MIELGQLESQHEEFTRRNVRVVVASLDDQAAAQETQKELPHLLVIADAGRGLTNAVSVLHPDSNPEGGDTSAPTTFLIDGNGQVRWRFRGESIFTRLTPAQLLNAIDEHLPQEPRTQGGLCPQPKEGECK